MRVVVGAIAAWALLIAGAQSEEFQRAHWIADFEQLKTAITQSSPNLDWALARGMDLPSLERRTRERLAGAGDASAARRALDRFVEAFGDGHMALSWPSATRAGGADAASTTCATLGYWSAPDVSAIATRLPGYQSLAPANATVEAGVAQVGGARIGVLRLSLFAPSDTLCERTLAELALAAGQPCDDACADLVSRRADNLFLAEIGERLRALREARPAAILVDVAGNGGGSDTSIAIARMVASADLHSPSIGVAKSAARAQSFAELADSLEAAAGNSEAHAFLAPLIAGLRGAQRDAGQPCDMTPIWAGMRPSCSNLARGNLFAGGLIPTELPERFRETAWAETVSATARFSYQANLWRGPLIVLVDANSASSTELFAAMLQDAGRALIIGAPTYGAGCGWNMPHQDVVLEHSGGRLSIPNCARFRRDGRNEIDGVEPDMVIGFRANDTPSQRVERLSVRLAAALQAARRR